MKYLIVDKVFELKDCRRFDGLVLTGSWPDYKVHIKIGHDVEIINPDGSIIKTTIIGMEHIRPLRAFSTSASPFGILVRNIGNIYPGAKLILNATDSY